MRKKWLNKEKNKKEKKSLRRKLLKIKHKEKL